MDEVCGAQGGGEGVPVVGEEGVAERLKDRVDATGDAGAEGAEVASDAGGVAGVIGDEEEGAEAALFEAVDQAIVGGDGSLDGGKGDAEGQGHGRGGDEVAGVEIAFERRMEAAQGRGVTGEGEGEAAVGFEVEIAGVEEVGGVRVPVRVPATQRRGWIQR